MAKSANKKKKRKLALPNKKLLLVGAVVVAIALLAGLVRLQHDHAVTEDKARFARAGNDVETVADAVVAAVGQPADRKDGGKCSYAHQEFGKGPLSCEVYAYLAYGVNSPDEVNAIVQKVDPLPVLHGTPWQFKAVTEKPHQFTGGVSYSDSFVPLHDLFDKEVKSTVYIDGLTKMSCAVDYLYQNTVSTLIGYPSFKIASDQINLIDINCTAGANSPYFTVQD